MARTEFDRARYPGVSAEDIEAALLYEFSQDADELRRLGAVDDSYQRMTFDRRGPPAGSSVGLPLVFRERGG